MSLPATLKSRLRLPLIAAPMFLVSGPALVKAACRAGIIGSFPTANCRTVEELDGWLADMSDDLLRAADEAGHAPPPLCPNLIVHRSNPRVPDDLAAVLRHKAEIVITSVGSPEPVLKPLKDSGCLVLADVASVRHAEKAVTAGVDGLVLLTAGAGGQTGWVNPFAFVRAVRKFWDGIVVMAGGMADGQAVAAAQALGCDLAYMGTKFIATRESLAKESYKEMLVRSRLDDVLLTRAFTGLETNMLRPSIAAAGLDPDNLPVRGAIDIAKDINAAERDKRDAEGPDAKRWKDIWSAGHSVSGVSDVPSVAELVERTAAEYVRARQSVQGV
ncbi:MAG TPA: nitronate monooxygenase family protein [Bradyrhizobium sp.]|nr:nitronate monooxygenase family protein [Bradyrhizobium sp.]